MNLGMLSLFLMVSTVAHCMFKPDQKAMKEWVQSCNVIAHIPHQGNLQALGYEPQEEVLVAAVRQGSDSYYCRNAVVSEKPCIDGAGRHLTFIQGKGVFFSVEGTNSVCWNQTSTDDSRKLDYTFDGSPIRALEYNAPKDELYIGADLTVTIFDCKGNKKEDIFVLPLETNFSRDSYIKTISCDSANDVLYKGLASGEIQKWEQLKFCKAAKIGEHIQSVKFDQNRKKTIYQSIYTITAELCKSQWA